MSRVGKKYWEASIADWLLDYPQLQPSDYLQLSAYIHFLERSLNEKRRIDELFPFDNDRPAGVKSRQGRKPRISEEEARLISDHLRHWKSHGGRAAELYMLKQYAKRYRYKSYKELEARLEAVK